MHTLGIFDSGRQNAEAIERVRATGVDAFKAYSPTPDHAIDQALRVEVSPVRTFTLVGALLGCFTGFAFPIYTVYDWPLITGGKALISIPPFVVIAFERTILFGAIGGMIGFLTLAGLPMLKRPVIEDPRFTNDKFGLLVSCAEDQADAVHAALAAAGAEEVTDHA